MRMKIVLIALAAAVALLGCSKEENDTSASRESAPAEQTAMEKTGQAVEQAKEKVEQTAAAAGEKIKEAADMAEEKITEATDQTRDKVAQMTDQAQEQAGQLQTKAKSLMQTAQSAVSTSSGEAVYNKSCRSCHDSGVMGAPKTGDKQAWEPLIENGMDSLVKNAINGIGKMPPKGGHSTLTDSEVKQAVEYMVDQSR